MSHQSYVLVSYTLALSVHLLAAVPFENGALLLTIVALGASTNTVPVLIEHSDSVDDVARTCVTAGGSTVIVCVERQGDDVAAPAMTAGAVVCATATSPTAAVEVAAALTTVEEIIEPVTVTVTGTLTVAVIVAGAALAVAVDAADPQESFWLVHSSIENPGPEIPIQAVN